MIDQALLPMGMGGLGLNINASEYADQQYLDSMLLTYQLTRYITHNEIVQSDYYKEIRNTIKKEKQKKRKNKLDQFYERVDIVHGKRMEEMQASGANRWLSCIPLAYKPEWTMTKNEFQDALHMRLNCLPRNCPVICPAQRCMEPFNLKHIDSCSYGGVIIRRHEYIKNIISKYAEKSFGTACVSVEPSLGELNEEEIQLVSGNITKNARADIVIMDYDGTQTSSYFDVSVISAVCDTHIEKEVLQTLKLGEKRKNTEYAARIKT